MSGEKNSRVPRPASDLLTWFGSSESISGFDNALAMHREPDAAHRAIQIGLRVRGIAPSRAVPIRSPNGLLLDLATSARLRQTSLVARSAGADQSPRARRLAWLASTALRSILGCTGSAGLLAAVSTAAGAQTVGPGLVGDTVNVGKNDTVTIVGSTDLRPNRGSSAAEVGPGTLILDPAAGTQQGAITALTTNATAFDIVNNGTLQIDPNNSGILTSITTHGSNAPAISISQGNANIILNNAAILTDGVNSDGIIINQPNITVDATNVNLTVTGAGSNALNFNANGGADTANFTNSTIFGPIVTP